MTRKDYQVLASALRQAMEEAYESGGYDSSAPVDYAIRDNIVPALLRDNPRFNEKRFLQHIFGDKS